MSLSFYVDEHVHGAITDGLRQRGVSLLTAQEDGRASINDDLLLKRASELQRVMISNDADMLREATHLMRNHAAFAGLVYLRQARITVAGAVEQLELIALTTASSDASNRIEYLPLW